MPLDYKKINRLEKLLKLQDAYTHWQMDMLRVLAGIQEASTMPPPPSVMNYVTQDMAEICPPHILEELRIDNDALLEWPSKGAVPQDFLQRYEVFYHRFRVFREHVFMEESGFEKVSGLKNKREMRADLDQEMIRLSRQGQTFALALAKIDDYEAMKQSFSSENLNEYIHRAGQVVVECLRPVDDAYYPCENEFFLCMRQTDVAGGLRGFQRFGEFLEAANIQYELNGQLESLTMTGCVAEPVEGSNIGELIEGLRRDINSLDKSRGNIFTYHELSPLQRFVNSQ